MQRGAGPWPVYAAEKAPVFTVEEKAVLTEWAAKHPELAKKIIGHSNALAAVVATHNRIATAHNLQILKDLGFTDEQLLELSRETNKAADEN